MLVLHPAHTAEAGEGFGVVRSQAQGTLRGLLAGLDVTGTEFGIGQHDPGNEVRGLAGDGGAQLRAFAGSVGHGINGDGRHCRGFCRACVIFAWVARVVQEGHPALLFDLHRLPP
jgi:hypothetical protein